MIVASNPRRRRHRRHLIAALNRRHHRYNRHRRHARNGRHRRHHRNPGASIMSAGSGILKSATSAFNVGTLEKAGVVVGGLVANEYASHYLAKLGNKVFPSIPLDSGWQSLLVGLVSAGLLGYGTKMVYPRYAAPVFFGAVIQVVKQGVHEYIQPHLPTLSGMGDYLTVGNAQSARPLGYFGDYLTVGNAQSARPLGEFAAIGEQAVGAELSSM